VAFKNSGHQDWAAVKISVEITGGWGATYEAAAVIDY